MLAVCRKYLEWLLKHARVYNHLWELMQVELGVNSLGTQRKHQVLQLLQRGIS